LPLRQAAYSAGATRTGGDDQPVWLTYPCNVAVPPRLQKLTQGAMFAGSDFLLMPSALTTPPCGLSQSYRHNALAKIGRFEASHGRIWPIPIEDRSTGFFCFDQMNPPSFAACVRTANDNHLSIAELLPVRRKLCRRRAMAAEPAKP